MELFVRLQVLNLSLAALGSLMWLRKNKPRTLVPLIYACAGILATMPSITRSLPLSRVYETCRRLKTPIHVKVPRVLNLYRERNFLSSLSLSMPLLSKFVRLVKAAHVDVCRARRRTCLVPPAFSPIFLYAMESGD